MKSITNFMTIAKQHIQDPHNTHVRLMKHVKPTSHVCKPMKHSHGTNTDLEKLVKTYIRHMIAHTYL